MRRLSLLLFASMCLFASVGRADGGTSPWPAHLTSQGRLMLTGGLSGFFNNDSTGGHGAQWRWGISGSPGFFYFVKDRVGLGAFASASYREIDMRAGIYETHQTDVGGGVRALFDLVLTDRLSVYVWPWLAYYGSFRTQVGVLTTGFFPGDGRSDTNDRFRYMQAGLSLPLVYAVNEHVGFGLGPYATLDFWTQRSRDVETGGGGATGQARENLARELPFSSTRVETGVMSTIFASF